MTGLASKIEREEAYHRMHAGMWADRLRGESRFEAALEELRDLPEDAGGLDELWEEMTVVRRSIPGATW